MGYTFTCDFCATEYDRAPPFMGELRESFLKTADSPLTELFQPGQTITVCRQCAEDQLL
jgi:hypothetical protein